MFEFFDPATGIVTALIAAGLRLLEAFWKQCNKRSKREYKLKRARQASDAATFRHGLGNVANLHISTADYDYTISNPKDAEDEQDATVAKDTT